MSDSTLALTFPGQGSQSLGMLAELANREPAIVETFAEASAGAGVDLWALVQTGPGEQLDRTEFTQPALLAAGVAVYRLWRARGGAQPGQVAGHSLGEYTALVAAGALPLEQAAQLVRTRGQLMQDAVAPGEGAMAAVIGAEDALVEQVCTEVSGSRVVAPANYNSPGQIVIAGHAEAVDAALAALGDRGVRKIVKLAVSVPSHTVLMGEAAERLANAMDGLEWTMPEIPVIQNVEAHTSSDLSSLRAALVQQLFRPVRWTGCVHALAQAGATRLGECGPGKVLTGLARRIDRALDARSLGTPEDLDAALAAWA